MGEVDRFVSISQEDCLRLRRLTEERVGNEGARSFMGVLKFSSDLSLIIAHTQSSYARMIEGSVPPARHDVLRLQVEGRDQPVSSYVFELDSARIIPEETTITDEEFQELLNRIREWDREHFRNPVAPVTDHDVLVLQRLATELEESGLPNAEITLTDRTESINIQLYLEQRDSRSVLKFIVYGDSFPAPQAYLFFIDNRQIIKEETTLSAEQFRLRLRQLKDWDRARSRSQL